MAGRSIAGQDFLLQRQSVAGTPVTNAMRRYLAMKGRPGWEGTSEPFYGVSGKMPTSVLATDETGTVEVEMSQCYNAIGAVAASRLALPTTTATADPTAFRHEFELNPFAEDTKALYTVQFGDSTQAVQMQDAVFNTMGLQVQRGDIPFTTEMKGRAPTTGATLAATNEVQTVTITGTPTGGTFTLSFQGFTTAAIAYNAIASAVDSALELLPSIGTGGVTVGGGPGPGTPYTVTFTGNNARKDVPLMTANGSFTGGTAPAIAVAQTTPGNPSNVAAVPISPKGYDVYADDTWATLGTTKLLAAYNANVNLGEKFAPDAPINSTISGFDTMLEQENQTYEVALRLGFDAVAVALMNTFVAGATKFLRWQSTGPLIGTGVNYLLQYDCAIKLTGRGSFGPAPNSPAVTVGDFTGVILPDDLTGKAVKLTLINTVPSY